MLPSVKDSQRNRLDDRFSVCGDDVPVVTEVVLMVCVDRRPFWRPSMPPASMPTPLRPSGNSTARTRVLTWRLSGDRIMVCVCAVSYTHLTLPTNHRV